MYVVIVNELKYKNSKGRQHTEKSTNIYTLIFNIHNSFKWRETKGGNISLHILYVRCARAWVSVLCQLCSDNL